MQIGMGTFRFLLAFFVAISHLWANMFGGPAAYAVWGFFVLSGFLMTEILRHKYGFAVQGLQKYAYNRFLRIFPLYYLSALMGLISIIVLARYHIDPKALNPQFYMPNSFVSWFVNITLLPISSGGGALVPVSGALAVEVGVYLLIPFMAYSKNAAWLGAILSFLLSCKMGMTVETFAARYSDFLTGYFAFAIGALINHYKNELERIAMPTISLLVWGVHCLAIGVISTWPWTYGLYISVLLSAWAVISLYRIKPSKIDTLLGDLSYPVYLLHTTVGAWFLFWFDATRSLSFFISAFIMTTAFSWILLICFDHPIQKLKKKANANQSEEISVEHYILEVSTKSKRFFFHRYTLRFMATLAVLAGIGIGIFAYKVLTNNTLEIYAWGPQESVEKGNVPNKQADGNAGLWIKTSLTSGLGKLKVYINDSPLRTEVTANLITASVPKEFFSNTGELKVSVKSSNGKIEKALGVFKIIDKGQSSGLEHVEHKKLDIAEWGPREIVKKGEIPNRQPDGNAGLWMKTNLAVGSVIPQVYINNKLIQSTMADYLITASIPKELFFNEDSIVIEIVIDGAKIYVGTLKISPK